MKTMENRRTDIDDRESCAGGEVIEASEKQGERGGWQAEPTNWNWRR